MKANLQVQKIDYKASKKGPSLTNKIKSIFQQNASSNLKVESFEVNAAEPTPANIANIDPSLDLLQTSIFSQENGLRKQFGGDQGSLAANLESFLRDSKIRRILDKYYPGASDEDLELLFNRINFVGCGYVAFINTILYQFEGREVEFEEKFGFPMYTVNFEDGPAYKQYNYEYLILDFFLYYAKNERGFQTIQEAYGNVAEEMALRSQDGALDDKKFDRTGMGGTNREVVGRVATQYLAERGIQCSIKEITDEKMAYQPGTPEWEAKKIEMEEAGYQVSDDDILYGPITNDVIKEKIRRGENFIVSAQDFHMFYPYDVDGNGQLDDVYNSSVGSHAMTLVGFTDDGRYIVSSWGQVFILDPEMDPIAIMEYNYE